MALTPYQKHVQSVLKKGGTMKQAAASWKKPSGIRHMIMTVRNRRAARKTTKVNNTASRRGRARAYIRARRGKGGAFSNAKIFKLLRFGALVAPAAFRALGPGSAQDKIQMGMRDYFGWNSYSQQMEWGAMLNGWGPFLAASLATYGIPKLTKIIRGI